MQKIFYLWLQLIVLASVLFISCEKGVEVVDPNESATPSVFNDVDVAEIETARTEFAKTLAKALKERGVREFLKTEALQQYDGDYDVLFALVKDKKLSTGETFGQALSKYTTSEVVNSWSKKVPLMTVFVPELKGFSPESWNLDSQTPDVVIDNSHLKDKTEKLVAFSTDLRRYEVSANVAPNFPVVVIKENERIVAKSKLGNGARKTFSLIEQKSNKVISQNATHSFYFIGDMDYKAASVKSKGARAMSSRNIPDALQFYNYHKSSRPNVPGNERDWVYYHIWAYFNEIELVSPYINGGQDYDWSKGSLGGVYYTERLTTLKFMHDYDLAFAADNWTEGQLDFQLIFSYIDRNGGLQNDLRSFGCPLSQLRDSNGNPVEYDPDVELNVWDMNRWGDEWKLTLSEYDPGGSTQITVTTKTTFGTNFETNVGGSFFGLVKLDGKFGLSGTYERTESKVETVSQESEQLGSVSFLFDYPVIANPGYPERFSLNTGRVYMSIEPVVKQNDPRPIPYID